MSTTTSGKKRLQTNLLKFISNSKKQNVNDGLTAEDMVINGSHNFIKSHCDNSIVSQDDNSIGTQDDNPEKYASLQISAAGEKNPVFFHLDFGSFTESQHQEIRNESNNFSYIIKDAKKSENKNLNRYRDVNPFDHSRVKLQRGDKDYINASLVNVPSADRSYILTQGPLPVTTGHFWLMVWEQKSKAILMLNRVIEKNAVKCHQYWPIGTRYGGEDDLTLMDVNLKITFVCQKEDSHYILREFQITDLESQDSRNVLQFHYTTWPDFGVPESPAAFLNFLFAVRESGALNSNVGPPVVHCSAGIGRSGTFCLVDSCLILIEKNNDPNSINIRQQLLEMRHYRMGLIQTPDQLRFSYLAIIEGAKKIMPQQDFQNVPLNNENNIQDVNWKCHALDYQSAKVSEGYESSNISPPPLPPRSIRNVDDLSPTSIKLISGTNYAECNGDINKSECVITEAKQSKCELVESSDKRVSNSVMDERDKLLSSEESSSKTHVSKENKSLPELRKRTRKEREEKTAAIVQNIKKKQKETELWEKRRSKRKRRKLCNP